MVGMKSTLASLHRRADWLAFRIRERNRERERYPTRWYPHLWLVYRNILLVHDAMPGLLTTDLVGTLTKAREASLAQTYKRSGLVVGIVAYLVLTQFNIELPVSVVGFQLTPTPGLNELLILAVAVLSCAIAGRTIGMVTLTVALKALIPLVYPYETSYLVNTATFLNEPPPFYRPPYLPHLVWRKITMVTQLLLVFMYAIVLMAVVGGSITWRVLVYGALWSDPSIASWWAHLAVATATTIDLGWLIFTLTYVVPLPHKDYGALHTLELAEQLGPDALARARQMIYGDDWQDKEAMRRKGFAV